MQRICIFADFPLGALTASGTGRGGGQLATWLPQLAQTWAHQTDFEIHWCVLDRKVRTASTEEAWGQVFHRLPHRGISAGMLLGRWPERLAFRKVLRSVRPELIHCWGTENLNGVALLGFSGPSILSMQGVLRAIDKTGDLTGWRWWLFKHWEPVSLRRAGLVTSESAWGLARVGEIVPGKPVRKVEYGVFPSFYDVTWSPAPQAPEVLFAGGLGRLKGVDILLEMLRRHPRRPWKMVFAGHGYLADSLRALADPMVEVLGNLTTQELQARMARAWVLVHPSRADTSPNVVKEARVVGLPVVGSPNGGHAEYIEHGVDGYVVGSEEPDQWFEVLDGLCGDHARCVRLGGVNHARFREHFRVAHTAAAFLKLYREVANGLVPPPS